MGHVPTGPVPAAGSHNELPRRQHRRARARNRALARARSNRAIARFGEELAVHFLERRGAEALGRNVFGGRGEIDILARIDGIVVAIEVKTRVGSEPGDAFTAEKSQRVRDAMMRVRPRPRRLDLVTVRLGADAVAIRWIPGVA